MTHPLTDRICGDIAENLPDYNAETCMRSAADWQLEQCTEELNGILSLFQLAGKIDEVERIGLLNVFKEAMRPQVVDLPQANSDVCGEEA